MCNSLGFWKHDQRMYMVFCPANSQYLTASRVDKFANVAMQWFQVFGLYGGTVGLQMEDDM